MLQKVRANAIFTGNQWLTNNEVLIFNEQTGEIVDIVTDISITDNDSVRNFDGVLVPGFVNCHCHLELSHLKNIIPQRTGIVNFIIAILENRNKIAQETVVSAMEEAQNSMVENGIVAVGDISNLPISIAVKKNKQLYYQNFIEVSGFSPLIAEQRFAFGLEVYHAFAQHFPNQTSLVPHAPYSLSQELFGKIQKLPQQTVISIHNQESADENLFFQTGEGSFRYLYDSLQVPIDDFFKPTGLSSLASVLHQLPSSTNCLLVHNTFTSEADIGMIKKMQENNQSIPAFCVCANANKYIENCLPNIPLLYNSGIPIVIGTDSLASNQQLCILNELTTLQNAFQQLNSDTLLTWATLNGAKALGIEHWAGSFEKGKKPGIILLENINHLSKLNTVKKITVIR